MYLEVGSGAAANKSKAANKKQPLEAPLRAFPPNQHNLLSVIQSWIDEIE